MGMTAELLGRQNGITREQQDAFGARSHQLAHKAHLEGRWANEIVPVEGHDANGVLKLIDYDGSTPRKHRWSMAALRPVFDPVNGTVTGTSSALSTVHRVRYLCQQTERKSWPNATCENSLNGQLVVMQQLWVMAQCQQHKKPLSALAYYGRY